MRHPGRRETHLSLARPNVVRLRNELETARNEIARLRHENAIQVAQRNSISDDRDNAIRERDRAVAELHRATAKAGSDSLDEFPGYVAVPRWRPLDYPGIVVETDASDQDIDRMCAALAGTWSSLGAQEPYFTNVAHDKFSMQNIAGSKAEFFQSGFQTLCDIQAIAQRQGTDLSAYRDCFELGCGVGRITAALATVFDTVYGMDVSTAHLRVASAELANTHARVELLPLDTISRIDAVPGFDFFVSFAVLQHNPPPLAAKLLDNLLAKVRVGGAACFQCQTYQTGYRFTVAEFLQGSLDYTSAPFSWEMHCIPQPVIYEMLSRRGYALLEVREKCGQVGGISQIFFARRDKAR